MYPQKRQYLTDIHPKSWEHPADRAALVALKKVKGLDLLIQTIFGNTTERSLRLFYLASAVRATEKQFPKVYSLLREACNVLDVKEPPEVFVTQNPMLNAGAVGLKKPFITLNSSIVDALSEDELLVVIGHELGHCLSGHTLYKTLLAVMLKLSFGLIRIPLAGIAIIPIILALKEWDRKSELTADRAGLLAGQTPDSSYRGLMKLAGGNNIGEMDINEFFLQAAEYDKSENIGDSFFKLLNLMNMSHPFPVIRLPELKRFVEDGSFDKILGGEYLRRKDTPEDENIWDTFKKAGDRYKQDTEESEDPLSKVFTNLGEKAQDMGKKAQDYLKDIFSK